MSGLFPPVPSQLNPLTAARKRYAAAMQAVEGAERADEEFDGFGIIPSEVTRELRIATLELAQAEEAELARARRQGGLS